MLEILVAVGWMGVPLLIISIWALEIILERMIYYRKYTKNISVSEDVWHSYLPDLLAKNAVDIASQKNRKYSVENFAESRILKRGKMDWLAFYLQTVSSRWAQERETSQNALPAAELVRFVLSDFLFQLGRRLDTLAIIARVAPLLGLLGTVTGLIKTFSSFGQSFDSTVPSRTAEAIMTSGIQEALLTTVAGLAIAIPVILAHRYLSAYQEEIAFLLENYSERLIRLWE